MKRRNTESQEAVLSVLTASKKAMSQDAIEKKMSVSADRVTIYRILNRFCEDGLVHKVVADDGKQYFAICARCEPKKKMIRDNHFHFRCTSCETIECLPSMVSYSIPRGYDVNRLNCVLIGTCKACARTYQR